MKVFIERLEEERELSFKGNVDALLVKLGINQEAVLVVRGKELLVSSDKVSDSDRIRILSVVSGG